MFNPFAPDNEDEQDQLVKREEAGGDYEEYAKASSNDPATGNTQGKSKQLSIGIWRVITPTMQEKPDN